VHETGPEEPERERQAEPDQESGRVWVVRPPQAAGAAAGAQRTYLDAWCVKAATSGKQGGEALAPAGSLSASGHSLGDLGHICEN